MKHRIEKLCSIIFSQTCSRLQTDIIEANKHLEKKDFAHLVKDANLVARCLPSRQFRVGRNDVS